MLSYIWWKFSLLIGWLTCDNYAILPLGHFIRQQYSIYCFIGVLARNIIRSPILAGNIMNDCGPLGRHARATSCWNKVLCPWIRSSMPNEMYNKRNGNWFRVQHNGIHPLGIIVPSGWHSIMLPSKPVTICILFDNHVPQLNYTTSQMWLS